MHKQTYYTNPSKIIFYYYTTIITQTFKNVKQPVFS